MASPFRILTTLLVAVLHAAGAVAQAPAPLALQRLPAPITLDGIPDEPAWQELTPLPLTVYAPVFRAPAKQRTEGTLEL